METGEHMLGTNPDRAKTGKGSANRMIKVKHIIPAKDEFDEDSETNIFYALSGKNFRIYKVEEQDFVKPGYNDPLVEEFKKNTDGRYKSYLGMDFGEVIKDNVVGYKSILEMFVGEVAPEDMDNYVLVFLGLEPNEDDPENSPEQVRVSLLIKDAKDGSAMDEVAFEKDEFVSHMLVPMEHETKRMTIHYINKQGEKSQMAVNSPNEIEDMDRELYRINN